MVGFICTMYHESLLGQRDKREDIFAIIWVERRVIMFIIMVSTVCWLISIICCIVIYCSAGW